MNDPWPVSCATGIGSLPYPDALEAVRVVFGELPDFPHLPELPGRGPGADMIGRTAAMLVDLPVERVPSGWRVAGLPGRDVRRAEELLARDLDALEEVASRHEGPLKVQVCGPWTLAASLERPNGHPALSDQGLLGDLLESLREGIVAHLTAVRRRVSGAQLVLQVDEPSAPAVLNGRVPTASGLGTVSAVAEDHVIGGLASVIQGARVSVAVHCCAAEPPVDVFRRAGADAVACDLERLSVSQDEALGGAVDAGMSLWLGAIPATPKQPHDTALMPAQRQTAARAPLAGPDAPPSRTLAPVRALWKRLGFDEGVAQDRTVLTPACGLAGADIDYARAALGAVREAALVFSEDPFGSAGGG